MKPTIKCPKHKKSFTIWYRATNELMCSKCNTILIKGKKSKK